MYLLATGADARISQLSEKGLRMCDVGHYHATGSLDRYYRWDGAIVRKIECHCDVTPDLIASAVNHVAYTLW